MTALTRRLTTGTALLALLAAANAGPAEVGPGRPAPPLSVKRWIKGSPVEEIKPKGIYVVEFWATTCAPCLETIPRLTAAAKKNPDVTFIGISIWEDDLGNTLDRFVKKMGPKMDYHVGYSGNEKGMAETWMRAAGQNGIPTAFVVSDGEVQWIGHPMAMDEPLSQVIAGTFDVESFREEFEKTAAVARKKLALSDELLNIDEQFSTDRKGAKVRLAKIAHDNPEAADSVASLRFGWLAAEDPKAWDLKARALAKSGKSADMDILLNFAYRQAMDDKTASARRAIAIALEAEPKGFDALNYAYRVFLQTKDYDRALDVTRKMLVYFPTGQIGGEPEFRDELLKRKADLVARMKSRA